MSTIFGIFGRLRKDKKFRWTKCIPFLILIAVSAISAAFFYLTERGQQNCGWNYWNALFFVNTAHTTIGYGNIAPCSWVGKLLTVIYCLVGIPISLLVLANLGDIFSAIVNAIWTEWACFCCCFRSRKVADGDPEKAKSSEAAKNAHLPLWIGFLMTFTWIFVAAVYFKFTEDWFYLDSVYFMFISVSTIGLGDFYPTDDKWCMVQFALIFLGMALFSLCISLVQQSLEELRENLSDKMATLYKESLAEAEEGGGMDDGQDAFKRFMKKEAGIQRHLVGRRNLKELTQNYMEFAKMQNKLVQTGLSAADTADKEVMAQIKTR